VKRNLTNRISVRNQDTCSADQQTKVLVGEKALSGIRTSTALIQAGKNRLGDSNICPTWPVKMKAALGDILKIMTATLFVFAISESFLRTAYYLRNSTIEHVVLPYNAAQDWGPIPPWMDGLRILERDEALSWKTRPNIHRSYLDVYSPVQVEEDRTRLLRQFFPTLPPSLLDNPTWEISTNSEGFRGNEFPANRDPSVFRIICLGDSWTFGANVDQAKSYPQQLSALLKREFPQGEFEVLNLGVMAYSSYQGLNLLKSKIDDLNPDMILIGFGMNDASVGGWRDKDNPGYHPNTFARKVHHIIENLESYKLARYFVNTMTHRSSSIGDYMMKMADVVGTPDEAWLGRHASENADYETLEPYTRVSPSDYEKNIIVMIELARSHGADVTLLYNELWRTPYRDVLQKLSVNEHVPLVDSQVLIRQAKRRIEDDLEENLGLRPQEPARPSAGSNGDVVFRVFSGEISVPNAIYIAGPDEQLGGGVPNRVALHDDGTQGDQVAGDHVWSLKSRFKPGKTVLYVYTNSGEQGRWEGLDIPEIRRFTVHPQGEGANVYRPIETFGEMSMQADGWHTNALGYELIAKGLLDALKKNEKVNTYLQTRIQTKT
jgi:lysophospholipase L1-like esterase